MGKAWPSFEAILQVAAQTCNEVVWSWQVLERRQGLNFRVNMKARGDTFGEVSLMYNVPRSATVAATRDSVVWVLERDQFRCR